jgi:hypothetical protein
MLKSRMQYATYISLRLRIEVKTRETHNYLMIGSSNHNSGISRRRCHICARYGLVHKARQPEMLMG